MEHSSPSPGPHERIRVDLPPSDAQPRAQHSSIHLVPPRLFHVEHLRRSWDEGPEGGTADTGWTPWCGATWRGKQRKCSTWNNLDAQPFRSFAVRGQTFSIPPLPPRLLCQEHSNKSAVRDEGRQYQITGT